MTKPTDIVVSAPAKLNLFLKILGKRADKYHQIETLLQSIDLCDQLEFCFQQSEKFEINIADVSASPCPGFPLDASNLIYKAANKFLERVENKPDIVIGIRVTKNIPVGSGLAGGSADAAATLLALNNYFGDRFPLTDLIEIASGLGSDVPFSLIGGTCIGKGKGDELERISSGDEINFIIVKARDIAIASSWAYSAFDEHTGLRPDQRIELGVNQSKQNQLSQVTSYLADKAIEQASQMFGNDLEPIVFKNHPVLKEIKETILEEGCLSAHMTGSGSSIFGVAKTRDQGESILKLLAAKQDRWAQQKDLIVDVWLVKSLNHGVRITNNSVTYSNCAGNKIK